MKNIDAFLTKKKNGEKISMLTCYDYSFAKMAEASDVDSLLVGDSLAMVMHGFDSTIHATLDMMCLHTRMVRRGAPTKFIIGDMPFLSTRTNKEEAVKAAGELMRAGANCVKLEGVDGQDGIIAHIIESGIPVMGHLGLTPQAVHQLSGYKVQGRENESAQKILNQAKKLVQLGCFSLVLECVPSELAETIAKELPIPVIGIGAGANVDGQVLVLQDMLGMNTDFKPKFVRTYSNLSELCVNSFNQFHKDVLSMSFPNAEESF